jgi:hypothetical protein
MHKTLDWERSTTPIFEVGSGYVRNSIFQVLFQLTAIAMIDYHV